MVEAVKTYTVKATRSGGWWVLTVPEVPRAVSQVRRLSQAEEYAREAIAFVLGVAPDDFALHVEADLSDDLEQRVRRAQQAAGEAQSAVSKASMLSREAVRALLGSGLSGNEVAVVLGISKQRVSQLARQGSKDGKAGARSA
jgi:DNA-directed RNA polymerase specialized sigma24 family protein